MSHRNVWAVLAVLGSALTAFGQSTPITLSVVHQADRDQQTIVVRQTVTEYRAVKQQVSVNVNGKVETREVIVMVPEVKEVLTTMSLKGVKAYSGDGKEIEDKQLWERLKPGAVLVWGDARLLQPPFDKAFRPEVVLLVNKAAPPPDAKNDP